MGIPPEQMCADILALLSHSKEAVFALAEEHGLTPAQMFSLFSLDQYGELPMGHVAATLHCDASNITGIVDRLTAQGLVVRKESARDRRTKTLALTTKGKKTVALLKAALPAKFGCDQLSEQERSTLHTIVQKVRVRPN